MKNYHIKSMWKTLQGEGHYAGRPAIFIRFVGCNLWSGYEKDRERDALENNASCPLWCDTDFTKEGSTSYSLEEFMNAIQNLDDNHSRFCVITGGEPLLHIDSEFIDALHQIGFEIAVETNGTVPLKKKCRNNYTGILSAPDWIVCSPKKSEEQLRLEYFDELKLVVPSYQPKDFDQFLNRQRPHQMAGRTVPLLWLQPEDGPNRNKSIELAVDLALKNPKWRVATQTHKYLNLD